MCIVGPCLKNIEVNALGINKAVGLLWCCYLIAGPSKEGICYFLSKVRCLTTDMGVEMYLLETPNIVFAFIAWCAGQELMSCAALVRHDERLFYNALRISGWGHMLGNLISKVFNKFHRWPDYLEKIRAMILFYKNATYRKHAAKCLEGTGVDTEPLAHFSANLAKWRYQTIFPRLKSYCHCAPFPKTILQRFGSRMFKSAKRCTLLSMLRTTSSSGHS